MEGTIIGIILAIPLGLIPAFLAKKKGHNFGLWWLYGWALFIVAIIHVMFIEDKTAAKASDYNSINTSYAPVKYSAVPTQTEITKNETEQTTKVSLGNTVEDLRSLKELLDSEIITQEEFDAKKKQILGL